MTEKTMTTLSDLEAKFAKTLKADERKGYEGYIVDVKSLVEVATVLRDELGYDTLSSVTAVDYIDDNMMEVVYHFFKSTGGTALTVGVQLSRDKAVAPSLIGLFPSADFQEREVWDLLGVKFTGHPDLRRILMWEGFEGHPLRKDYKEAYYQEESKPFHNRWPEGAVHRSEDKNAFGKNVVYPKGFDSPETVDPNVDNPMYDELKKLADQQMEDNALATEHVLVNMGPQHPSTHGVFRMSVVLDGETIVALKPVMGYLHRNHEKIGERNTYLGNMPYTDRLDYLSSMTNNFSYAVAVEKMLGDKVTVPERAEYLRVIMAELTRISNHIWAVGFLLNDLGAYFTPTLYATEERELILDIFEATAGSRMMCNYFRFGGVSRDIPEEYFEKLKILVADRLPRKIDALDRYLTDNEIIKERTMGVGVLSPDEAIAYGATGPVLRASGVPYDIRRAEPYSIYDRFDFEVSMGYHGDTYDRYLIRLFEARQSLRILEQAVRDIPEGPVLLKNPYNVRVPAGEAYGRTEAPKGELGFYLVSDGTANPFRYHIRSPSFINLTALEKMCVGGTVADAIAILGSIDIVLGDVDR